MYTIIGGDGKEYGPVTADQVRSWVAGGRANLQTKVKLEGTGEWKSVAEFPEITGAGAPAPGASNLDAPSPDAAAAALAQLPAVAQELDIMSCFERSWALLKANFWPLVGVTFLIALIMGAIGSTLFGILYLTPPLSGLLAGGLFYYFLKTVRGLPTSVGDAFAGFSKAFGSLLAAGIVVYCFRAIGFFLLLLPGIYLTVAYAFAFILPIDKGLGFWEAMETSRKVITRQWWRMFGLLLLGIPFVLLGLVALGVGVFVTIPLVVGAVVYAYEDLCNPRR
jgi:uncharacterized membrane protein